MIANSNDVYNFSHELLLTNIQVSRFRKASANNSSTSANIKSSKTQFYKMGESVGFLGRLLETLPKTGSHLMKNVL